MNSARTRDVNIYWFTFDYGVMYDTKFSNDIAFSVGLTYKQPANLRGNLEAFLRTSVGGVGEWLKLSSTPYRMVKTKSGITCLRA